MIKWPVTRQNIAMWTNLLLLSLLVLAMFLPSVVISSEVEIRKIESGIQHEQDLDSYSEMMNEPLDTSKLIENATKDKIKHSKAQEDPEAYFPDFLYYSVTAANALIDYLYDNVTGGFYRSSNEHWLENSIDTNKHVHDQSRAIIALLKLSQAVINETERDYAIEIANQTANFMISELWDPEFEGFYLIDSGQTQKPPGMQGIAIQALVELYKVTGNQTLLDKAYDTLDFANDNGWDSTGGYFYLLSHSGVLPSSNIDQSDPYPPEAKRVDHNVVMGQALLNLYSLSSDPQHLSRAIELYQFLNSTCRNVTTGLFYTGVDGENRTVEPFESDVFVNSFVLEFLSQLYEVTGDSIYYDDFFNLLNQVLINFWDNRYGGFYTTYSYDDQVPRDTSKYTDRQFYAMRALDEAYSLTNQSFYYNLIQDLMEIIIDSLYDQVHEGFYHLTSMEGVSVDPTWNDKLTVTNSLAIYEMANVWLYSRPGVLNALWSPSQPRPQDSVEIIIAAFDADGITSVQFNYSINDDPYQIVEMEPHPEIGNMYRTAFDSQPHGTTINFNVIVIDELSNEAVRGNYFFLWQDDVWEPHVEEVGVLPDFNVAVFTGVSMTVSALDVPSQGHIVAVSIHYHEAGQDEEIRTLQRSSISEVLWEIEFPDGFDHPLTYIYYYVAIDGNGNIGTSPYYSLIVYGVKVTLPLLPIVMVLFAIMLVVPGGLYVYVERKKKQARTKIKVLKQQKRLVRTGQRGTRRR
ncbi:MAG: AGE family epimerase/isomerase [Candidatus Hodarchaeales archaeon]